MDRTEAPPRAPCRALGEPGDLRREGKKPRPKLSELKGMLIVGSQRWELKGRVVLIHGRLAARTEWVTETPLGSVIADFAYAQVQLKLVESLKTIEVEDD